MPARYRRAVRCIETGEVYQSLGQAARHNNTFPQNVHRSIFTGRKTHGLSWEYADGGDNQPAPIEIDVDLTVQPP
eukprot:g49382.t1